MMPVASPLPARRRIAAIMVWLLPEPDSPTTATVSPALTCMLMPLTASTMPSRVRNRTCRFSTEWIVAFFSVIASPVLRIERVAQSVADKVKGEESRHKEKGREKQQPIGRADVLRALRYEDPPTGHWLLDAEP